MGSLCHMTGVGVGHVIHWTAQITIHGFGTKILIFHNTNKIQSQITHLLSVLAGILKFESGLL